MEFRTAFESNEEVQMYGDNALLIFAMMLKFQAIDSNDLAAECLTDGRDDKKIDFIRYDSEAGSITLAQAYFARDWDKQSAPSNKAADLNTAISWLLSGDISQIPRNLRSKALAIRDALEEGNVQSLEILYVHNLSSSSNVQSELQTCAFNANRLLRTYDTEIEVKFAEIDAKQINDWYLSHERTISINDVVRIPIDGYLLETGTGWEAVTTTTNIENIQNLYSKYSDILFSANVRGFLGTRRSSRNINQQIKLTAENEPENFWIYNNGITAITNKIISFDDNNIELSGIAIINGAQTTGSVSSAKLAKDRSARVLLRVIRPSHLDLINSVVKYNNTQNVIYTWELRSGDRFQRRLSNEFESIGIKYLNRRSYGRAVGEVVAVPAAAQALMAFHGKPLIALKGKAEIFDSDTNYSTIFNDHTTARHICFVYSIVLAFDEFKNRLKAKSAAELIDTEIRNLEYMSLFSYKQFLVYCVGHSLENIVNRRITSKISLHFKSDKVNLNKMASYWADILSTVVDGISHSATSTAELQSVLKSDERMVKLADSVRSFVSSIRTYAAKKFDDFSKKVDGEMA